MTSKFNPFQPNNPVGVGLFAGRHKEMSKIDDALFQTANMNPTNLLFIGERGIGKTSLLIAAKHFARGVFKWSDKLHDFLTLQFSLNSDLDPIGFILKFRNVFDRELNRVFKTKKKFGDIWGFIKKFEVLGCKFNDVPTSDIQILIDDFTYSLINIAKKITENKENPRDGVVIFIDEADTASSNLNFGSFLKNLSETLISEGCRNVVFVLTGLPNVVDVLRTSHPSSLRLFEEITIKPLQFKDVEYVISCAIREINEKSPNFKLKATSKAIDEFHSLSEGYPHFLQQIGYSTISILESNEITDSLVLDAMLRKGGALELIGNRYYNSLFYNKINSDSYRQILSIMAKNWDEWISKSEIRKNFTGSGSTLDNGIKALKDRNIILTKRGVKGHYRLQWQSFAFWIKTQNKYKDVVLG